MDYELSVNSTTYYSTDLRMSMPTVSVIIPTLDEATALPATLDQLDHCHPRANEVIIVDGGSMDDTLAIANKFDTKLITTSQKGRGHQMNKGAEEAKGEVLVFLHADTIVPQNFITTVQKTLSEPDIALAGFISIMKGSRHQWFLTSQNYLKTYVIAFIMDPVNMMFRGFRLLFGDQVMFCRRKEFLSVGGFNEAMQVLEDGDLCVRMNKLGAIRQVNQFVFSSDRRAEHWGTFPAYFRYLRILISWMHHRRKGSFNASYEDIR